MAPLVAMARLSGLLVFLLIIIWTIFFRTTFFIHSSATSTILHPDSFYSAIHPLLMVIGLVLLSGEGILAHTWLLSSSRETRKLVHLCLNGAALGFGIFGVWVKLKSNRGFFGNFYSLHSWIGILSVVLFGVQWVVGFLNFWRQPESRRTTATLLPWHVFLGFYSYVLSVAAAEAGLVEKVASLQSKHGLGLHSSETKIVNALGISLAVLSTLVVLISISPKRKSNILISKADEDLNLNFVSS